GGRQSNGSGAPSAACSRGARARGSDGPRPRASLGEASLGFTPLVREAPDYSCSRAPGGALRSKTASTIRVVAGPTGAPAPRTRPGTHSISPPAASTGTSARASRGTLASTRSEEHTSELH